MSQSPPDPQQERDRLRAMRSADANTSEWYRVAGIGFEFVAAVLLLSAAGFGLDRWLGTSPWLLLGGMVLGFVVGLVMMIRSAKKTFHD
jgi:ATP synthase protein I